VGAPKVGDPLPEFEAALPDGGVWKSSEQRGKPLVLYFYPKDFTSGCTKEACQFRDAYETLNGALGADIVGISRDDGERHEAFRKEYKLPFPLLSDPGGRIAALFGATHLGGLLPLTKRVTYVVDAGGTIRGVFHHEFAIGRHVKEVQACLESLKG
jgi:peroxiredoxin Q/BCP